MGLEVVYSGKFWSVFAAVGDGSRKGAMWGLAQISLADKKKGLCYMVKVFE